MIAKVNETITAKDYFNIFLQHMDMDQLKEESNLSLDELNSIEEVPQSSNLDDFIEEYRKTGAIIERVSAIHGHFTIKEKKFKRWFDKLNFLLFQEKSAKRGEKEIQKNYIELALWEYYLVLEKIEEIVIKAETLKSVYQTRLGTISRCLAYLEYKKISQNKV